MNEYPEEALRAFLKNQEQLFDERVADTLEEAEEFLEDCLAIIVDSVEEVMEYFEENGYDTSDYSPEDIVENAEVFSLPSGRFLIVEA